MPITFRIDKESGIVYTTINGRTNTDEIVESLENLLNNPDFKPGLNGIADLRNSEMDTFSADVKRIAGLMIEYRNKIGPSKTAVVISKDVTFGMTRVFQAFSEQSSIETAIFRDMEEALRWLGARNAITDKPGG
jgi:hypothetical protein